MPIAGKTRRAQSGTDLPIKGKYDGRKTSFPYVRCGDFLKKRVDSRAGRNGQPENYPV